MSGPWPDVKRALAATRFLLVGEAPSGKKRNLDVALACRAVGWRPIAGTMARLAESYPDLFCFTMATRHVNLLPVDQPRMAKGRAFPLAQAREVVRTWDPRLAAEGYVAVLLAGHRVAAAFGAGSRPYLEWFDREAKVPGTRFAVVPHPSGVSAWYNDEVNRASARAFLESLGAQCRDMS